MQIKIRLFAVMAQTAGRSEYLLTWPGEDRPTAGAVAGALRRELPQMIWPAGTVLAVNQEYAALDRPVSASDEVAIIPPVSGG